jgi:glycine/D-amino acid oxidase-like deaminating enzyme
VSGLITAAMLADHGVDVVVVDAGSGSESVTVRSTAKVSLLHELSAAKVAQRRGRHVALDYVSANQFGFEWIAGYVEKGDVECAWEHRDAVTYVNNPSSFDELESEAQLYAAGGVDVELDVPRDVPFEFRRSVTAPNQAQFDPAAFLGHIVDDLTANGNHVSYGTRVSGIGRARGVVVVKTSAGHITAGHVIVATGLPFLDRGLHFARAEPQSSYIVACEVEAATPSSATARSSPGRTITSGYEPSRTGSWHRTT